MDIRGQIVLDKFKTKHSDAVRPLDRWQDLTENAQWANFAQVRETFQSADLYTQDGIAYVIFNIAGNKYRLMTEVDYAGILVVVDMVMTHAEYNKDRWKGRL